MIPSGGGGPSRVPPAPGDHNRDVSTVSSPPRQFAQGGQSFAAIARAVSPVPKVGGKTAALPRVESTGGARADQPAGAPPVVTPVPTLGEASPVEAIVAGTPPPEMLALQEKNRLLEAQVAQLRAVVGASAPSSIPSAPVPGSSGPLIAPHLSSDNLISTGPTSSSGAAPAATQRPPASSAPSAPSGACGTADPIRQAMHGAGIRETASRLVGSPLEGLPLTGSGHVRFQLPYPSAPALGGGQRSTGALAVGGTGAPPPYMPLNAGPYAALNGPGGAYAAHLAAEAAQRAAAPMPPALPAGPPVSPVSPCPSSANASQPAYVGRAPAPLATGYGGGASGQQLGMWGGGAPALGGQLHGGGGAAPPAPYGYALQAQYGPLEGPPHGAAAPSYGYGQLGGYPQTAVQPFGSASAAQAAQYGGSMAAYDSPAFGSAALGGAPYGTAPGMVPSLGAYPSQAPPNYGGPAAVQGGPFFGTAPPPYNPSPFHASPASVGGTAPPRASSALPQVENFAGRRVRSVADLVELPGIEILSVVKSPQDAVAAVVSVDGLLKAALAWFTYMCLISHVSPSLRDSFAGYMNALFGVNGGDGLTDQWARPKDTINGHRVQLSVPEVVTQALLFHRKVTTMVTSGVITAWPQYLGQYVEGPGGPPPIASAVATLLNEVTGNIAAHAHAVALAAAAAQESGRTAEGSAKAKSAATATPKAKAPAAPPVSLEGGHANFQQAVRDVQASPTPVCAAVGRTYCTKFAIKGCTFPDCKYVHACLHCNGQHALRLCPARDGPGARA